MEIQCLENINIQYNVRFSNKSKRLSLKIQKHSWLEIIIPKYFPHGSAVHFIESKLEWISKHLNKLKNLRTLDISNNWQISIPRELITIKINKTMIWNSYSIRKWNILILACSVSKKNQKQEIKNTFENYLKQVSKTHLENRSTFFAEKMWVRFNTITIKSQKTRWWSCSSKWNINYNYKIILCPTPIIDYLVVHELSHLKIMWHDKKFWNLVGSILPNYRLERKWLKENGETIVI